MSYYFNYYCGIMDSNGMIKPVGPYNYNNKLKPIIERSRSFASDLHDYFYCVQKEYITEELEEAFGYDCGDGVKKCEVKYLPVEDLPDGSYLKAGYYLIDDIKDWEENPNQISFDGFYNMISPTIYAEKMRNRLIYGSEKPKPKQDDDGNEYYEHDINEYMYSVIPDYGSKEYEADIIRGVCYMLIDEYEIPKGNRLVVLETEG